MSRSYRRPGPDCVWLCVRQWRTAVGRLTHQLRSKGQVRGRGSPGTGVPNKACTKTQEVGLCKGPRTRLSQGEPTCRAIMSGGDMTHRLAGAKTCLAGALLVHSKGRIWHPAHPYRESSPRSLWFTPKTLMHENGR